MNNKIIPEAGFTLVEIMIVVVLIALLAAITIPNAVWPSTGSQKEACINNLRLIDAAKRSWALEQHKLSTDTPQATDLQPYLDRGGELPSCPADPAQTFTTSYALGSVGAKPLCLIIPTTHAFPRYGWLYDVIHYRDMPILVIRLLLASGLIFIFWRRYSQKKRLPNPAGS